MTRREQLSRAPPDPPRPHDRATPAFMAALGVIGEGSGANAELGERAAWRGAPGDGLARSRYCGGS